MPNRWLAAAVFSVLMLGAFPLWATEVKTAVLRIDRVVGPPISRLDAPPADLGFAGAMRPLTRLRHVVLPQLAPFIAGAARSGIAVIWKIVLVVEFLGRSSGIGFQIHFYFQLFDVAMQ